MIELKDVCFAYGKDVALRHIDLSIQRGECVIVRGPNGCGKSTLIRLLNGVIFPAQGSYLFDGQEITEKRLKDALFAKRFHQRLGYVFQNADTQLFCGSVEDEIAFGPIQMGLDEQEVRRRTEDCLTLFDLKELRERAPYHLSGGEKRRVSLACILSLNPDVLVLDEPLAGLDEETQAFLTDFLRQLRDSGKTLIIITHSSSLARVLGTRFITMGKDHSVVRDALSLD